MSWKDILKREWPQPEDMDDPKPPYKEPSYYKQRPWKGHAHAEKIKELERAKLIELEEGEEMTDEELEYDFPERVKVDGKQWFILTKLGNMAIYSINRVARDPEGWQLKPTKEGDLDHTITLSHKEATEAAI